MDVWRNLAIAAVFFAFSAVAPYSAKGAGFVDDIHGVVTDPVKLGKASEELSNAVDRTLNGLRELEQVANQDVTARIEQLRMIVAEVIAAVDRNVADLRETVNTSLRKVQDIEEKTYRDAIDLMYRAQCKVEVFTSDQLERSLARLIETIIDANPGITILGIRVGGVSVKSVTITDPDKAYVSTKRYYLEHLKTLKESDPAFEILSAYQNIARFARFTRCHYLDLQEGLLFVEEQKDFEIKSSPWLRVVRVTVQ